MARLTKRTVEAAKVKEKDYLIFDSELSGFGLRVMPSGRKIFVLQYRIGVRTRRFTLGSFPGLTPELAREKAFQTLAAIHDGHDPMAEKQAFAACPDVKELCQRFQEIHATQHLKPCTTVRYDCLIRNHIVPTIGRLKITEVTRAHIMRLHFSMSKIPSSANQALALLSKMFNLAEDWGLRPENTNPCRHIKKYREKKRERFLSPTEMRRLGETLRMAEEAKLCSPFAIAAFRLLILTGARLGEIQHCKWEYVHLDRGVIRLPDSKTGPRTIHLGRTAIALLHAMPRKPGNPYLICSDHKPDEPIQDLQNTWRVIKKWAKIEDVRIHDLRHTFASNAVTMGMSLPMIGRLLGHTQTQTTARYAHLAVSPVLEAATKVTREIGILLELPEPKEPLTIDGTATFVEAVDPAPLVKEFGLDSTEDLPNFLTSAQAARYLNLNPRLLDDWRWRRKGPRYVKIGNNVRYAREDLDAFVQ
ncbi:MAG: tyrosine-type recombinase/integrase [Alphaproteobacteria bacterium]|nr:tyrosine-type recombinase/integrase [Alphaproteobacteria bacterium]